MARPKEFEPAEALNKAMQLFWQKGYGETSLDDLVQATGVSRYGFYSSFGDKHELFLKAMELYTETVISRVLGPMERPDAGLAEIRGYFSFLMQHQAAAERQAGCLIGNSALEIAATDAAVAARVHNHFARMRGAFLNSLRHAAERGELDADRDLEAHADHLVGVVLGYLGCVKAKLSREATARFLTVALSTLL